MDEYNGISVVKLDTISMRSTKPYETVTASLNDAANEAFHTVQNNHFLETSKNKLN